MTNDRIVTGVKTLGGKDPWAQGQSFMTVEQLQAQIASLTAEIKRAYAEGFGDAWAIAHENLNQVAEHDICWGLSHARAALQNMEGEG